LLHILLQNPGNGLARVNAARIKFSRHFVPNDATIEKPLYGGSFSFSLDREDEQRPSREPRVSRSNSRARSTSKIDAKRISSVYLVSLERDVVGDATAVGEKKNCLATRARFVSLSLSLSRFEGPTARTNKSGGDLRPSSTLRRSGWIYAILLGVCLPSGNLSERNREGLWTKKETKEREIREGETYSREKIAVEGEAGG